MYTLPEARILGGCLPPPARILNHTPVGIIMETERGQGTFLPKVVGGPKGPARPLREVGRVTLNRRLEAMSKARSKDLLRAASSVARGKKENFADAVKVISEQPLGDGYTTNIVRRTTISCTPSYEMKSVIEEISRLEAISATPHERGDDECSKSGNEDKGGGTASEKAEGTVTQPSGQGCTPQVVPIAADGSKHDRGKFPVNGDDGVGIKERSKNLSEAHNNLSDSNEPRKEAELLETAEPGIAVSGAPELAGTNEETTTQELARTNEATTIQEQQGTLADKETVEEEYAVPEHIESEERKQEEESPLDGEPIEEDLAVPQKGDHEEENLTALARQEPRKGAPEGAGDRREEKDTESMSSPKAKQDGMHMAMPPRTPPKEEEYDITHSRTPHNPHMAMPPITPPKDENVVNVDGKAPSPSHAGLPPRRRPGEGRRRTSNPSIGNKQDDEGSHGGEGTSNQQGDHDGSVFRLAAERNMVSPDRGGGDHDDDHDEHDDHDGKDLYSLAPEKNAQKSAGHTPSNAIDNDLFSLSPEKNAKTMTGGASSVNNDLLSLESERNAAQKVSNSGINNDLIGLAPESSNKAMGASSIDNGLFSLAPENSTIKAGHNNGINNNLFSLSPEKNTKMGGSSGINNDLFSLAPQSNAPKAGDSSINNDLFSLAPENGIKIAGHNNGINNDLFSLAPSSADKNPSNPSDVFSQRKDKAETKHGVNVPPASTTTASENRGRGLGRRAFGDNINDNKDKALLGSRTEPETLGTLGEGGEQDASTKRVGRRRPAAPVAAPMVEQSEEMNEIDMLLAGNR